MLPIKSRPPSATNHLYLNMPASAPANSHARAVVLHHVNGSSADDSDDSDSLAEFPATSTSMQGHDRQRLKRLEKVCTEELTGNRSLFDPNVIGP